MNTYHQSVGRFRGLMAEMLFALFAPLCAFAQDATTITYTPLSDYCDKGSDQGQSLNSLFDGQKSTTWQMDRFKEAGNQCVVTFRTSVPVNVCAYRITTGSDEPSLNKARSPKSWKLYGRNDQPTTGGVITVGR